MGIAALNPALFFANVLLRPITFIETVDFDDSLPTVSLNDYTFHAETIGEPKNPVIIALHGGLGAIIVIRCRLRR